MTSELNQVNISRKISSCKNYLIKAYQMIFSIYYVTVIIEHVRLDSFA